MNKTLFKCYRQRQDDAGESLSATNLSAEQAEQQSLAALGQLTEAQIALILESVLFTATEPLSLEQLRNVFVRGEKPNKQLLKQALQLLSEQYQDRAVNLVEVASGYSFRVQQSYAPWVARQFQEKPPRYSRALLETLALIAYKQPVTRAEIEEVRGVAVSSTILKTMEDRTWIEIIGHREVPGRPAIYATTKQFLDYFNLQSLTDLPALTQAEDLDEVAENLELALTDPGTINADQPNKTATLSDDSLLKIEYAFAEADQVCLATDAAEAESTEAEPTETETEIAATSEA